MNLKNYLICLLLLTMCGRAFSQTTQPAGPKLELRDGDRVVFVGSTLIEREQDCGYIETMLVTRFPGRHVMFRNVGYSGDTVSGEARGLCTGWSTFESQSQGLERLRKAIREIKLTVLIVGYGMNESFNGPEKLADFTSGLNMLLDMLSADAAQGDGAGIRQVLLLSPNYHEDLGRPLPDPTDHNRNLKLYSQAISEVAAKRNATFVDLFSITEKLAKDGHLTANGIHLTPAGYRKVAIELEGALGLPAHSQGGTHGNGLTMDWTAEGGQAEELRKLIVAKNFDFFAYFRPENDSYILSFRKREQGQNAVELPKFKPLAQEKDARIAELSALRGELPVTTFDLSRPDSDKKK